MNRYIDDSFALHTDLYQINMAEAYWEDNKKLYELLI
jgi:nicotinate phosphoribosyltransferase